MEDILLYSKNKDDGTFTECVGEISNTALKAKDIKREVTGKSHYLEHLLSPLFDIEAMLLKEMDSPETVSQLEFLTARLYEIGKEYAESGKKELEDTLIKIIRSLEDNVKYSYINKIHFNKFNINVWHIYDIIKKCIENNMLKTAETMLLGMINTLNEITEAQLRDDTLFTYLDEILRKFLVLCAYMKVKGKDLNRILNRICTTIRKEEQINLIKEYLSIYIEKGVFMDDSEIRRSTENEADEINKTIKYILNQIIERCGQSQNQTLNSKIAP